MRHEVVKGKGTEREENKVNAIRHPGRWNGIPAEKKKKFQLKIKRQVYIVWSIY
jgi:hypothetical protein